MSLGSTLLDLCQAAVLALGLSLLPLEMAVPELGARQCFKQKRKMGKMGAGALKGKSKQAGLVRGQSVCALGLFNVICLTPECWKLFHTKRPPFWWYGNG